MEVQKLNLGKGAFITSASEHPASNVYSVADLIVLNSLTETAQEGDVAIVQDAGDGTPARFIKPIEPAFNISTGELLFWIPIEDKVTTVAERATLNDIFFAMQIQTGETVIVEDMGDGSLGSFVYAGVMQWIEVNKTYLVSDLDQRNQFISLSASSQLGIDGSIKIEAPDEDISSGLTTLPTNFLDAARWMKTPCTSRTGEDVSRFVIIGKDAMPTAPDDLLPSPASLWLGE